MRVTVSNLVIFDTSVFIDHLRTGLHQQQIESVTGLIRMSSVVLTSHGARLITSNRSDFEIINRYRRLQLEIW